MPHKPSRSIVALTLALVLFGGAGALAAKGRLSGRTSQGLRVTLGSVHGGYRTFSYQARLNCSDGTTFTDARFSDDVRLRSGRFRVAYASDRGATRTIVRGRLSRGRARGRLSIVERYSATADAGGVTPLDPKGSVICRATVSWSAR